MSRLVQGRKAVDLGCGRGEFAFQLAAAGFDVTAIDYSAASIAIAKNNFPAGDTSIANKIDFLCGDITAFDVEDKFDFVAAADVIEHLSPSELDRLYDSVARCLKRGGLFVLHTAPSVWFNGKAYARRRASVERLGNTCRPSRGRATNCCFTSTNNLPLGSGANCRSNSPTSRFGSPMEGLPLGNLRSKFTLEEMVASRDIYAVASNTPIDLEDLEAVLSPSVIRDGEHRKVSMSVTKWPSEIVAGKPRECPRDIAQWKCPASSSRGVHPVCLSYHWFTRAQGSNHCPRRNPDNPLTRHRAGRSSPGRRPSSGA